MTHHLHIDVETCSALDLRKAGAHRYSMHPSTVVTVFSWAFDDEPVQSVTAPRGLATLQIPVKVQQAFKTGVPVRVHAWNAMFEICILRNTLGLYHQLGSWDCTMLRSAYFGYPMKLEDAGAAMGLKVSKGNAAIMRKCMKPKPGGSFATDDPALLKELAEYCKLDVETERAAANAMPELPADEQFLALRDRIANLHGIKIDVTLVDKMLAISKEETDRLNALGKQITGGAVSSISTQNKRLEDWLRAKGTDLDGVGKDNIAETLETAEDAELDPDVIKALGVRKLAAKSSVRKLDAIRNCYDDDQRVRGSIQHYGASRTGRSSGRLIQVQNFPRPIAGANAVITAIHGGADADLLRTFYGEPLALVSGALRGVMIPSEHHKLVVIDLAQIEARLASWFGDDQVMLGIFRNGEDPYEYTSNQLGLGSRQGGKATVLGLGFGQGPKRFVEFAKGYGVTLDLGQSETIVRDWREANAGIVKFWWDLDAVVRKAIASPPMQARMRRDVGKGVWVYKADDALVLHLPSGRELYYRNARLVQNPEKQREDIVYDGVDQITKKWSPQRSWGSKFFENLVQATARDVIFRAAFEAEMTVGNLTLLFSVHDELVFEAPWQDADACYSDLLRIAETTPSYLPGLPIAASGGVLSRYGKA